MSKTTMRQVPLWKVVPAAAKPELYLERELPGFAEWVRLLVGRSLAFAQLGANGGIEYLVLGIPLDADALKLDDGANRRVKDSLNADFEVLKAALQKHKAIISSPKLSGPPETFLRAYGALALLNLPEKLSDWHVTDEGLTIVNWGLEKGKGKRLFDWKPEELEAKRTQLIQQIDARLSPSKVDVASSGRNGSEESAQVERSIDKTLQDPLPSGGSKVKWSAPEPKPGGSQPTRPEPEPPKGLRAWFSHPAMTVSIQVVIALMLAGTGFAVERFVLSNSAEQAAAATNAETKRDQTAARYEKLVKRANAVRKSCDVDPEVAIQQLLRFKMDFSSACDDFDKNSELSKQWEAMQGELRNAGDKAVTDEADEKALQERLEALKAAFNEWNEIRPASSAEKDGKVRGSAVGPPSPSVAEPSGSPEHRTVPTLEVRKKLEAKLAALIDDLIKNRPKLSPQAASGSELNPASPPASLPTGPQSGASGFKPLVGQQGSIDEALREPLAKLSKVVLDFQKAIKRTEKEAAKIKKCMSDRDKEVQELHDAVQDLSAAADSDQPKPEGSGSRSSKSGASSNPPANTKQGSKDTPADRKAKDSGGAVDTAGSSTTVPNADSKKGDPK